ncbi:MAG TPA: S8 family serine peptidase [Thermoanaerobaculia bacterium]|nr:S8 family serine peptidase [Thermoanaerobaculia bacterium]
MKRATVILFVLLLTTTAFAAETRRYLVATKRPFAAGGFKALQDSVDTSVELRRVNGFVAFRGFAAELTDDEVATLRASREVRWIEPVVERHAFDFARNLKGQTIPYGIVALSARQAAAGFRKGVVNVAVIDTGIDYNHPELKAIYAGGYNVFTKTNDPMDDHGHGTHVSGTIAAADNNLGVIGVAPNVRLWSVKMLNAGGSGESEGMIAALEWVMKKKQEIGGRWVVNMSLGSDQQSEAEREVFARVADEDIIVVAAAGNASTAGNPAPVAFPAAYPNVLAIAAVDNQRKLAFFSCQGPEIDFAAPGVNVLSTVPVGTNTLAYISDDTSINEVSALNGSKRGTLTAPYVYVGLGRPEDFPAGGVAGKIALIQRGDTTFANKTRAAKAANAAAVVIFNNDASVNPWTLYSDAAANKEEWPIVLRLSQEQGAALAAKGTGTLTVSHDNDDYGEISGTSMSAPHVAGAMALLWSFAPDARPDELYSALAMTAIDLGAPGHDVEFGAGSINVYAAGLRLAPSAFVGGATTGRGMGRRGGKK